MRALIHPADIRDRDSGVLAMATCSGCSPFLAKLYADGGNQGRFCRAVDRVIADVNVEIVKRSDQAKGSRSCHVVGSSNEHSLGSADAEGSRKIESVGESCKALAHLRLASIQLMLRKLCNPA